MTTRTRTTGASRPTRLRFPTASERHFALTLWTDDPALAAQADAAGVDRIGLDLERRGKRARQAGRGTWISPHRVERLEAVGLRLARAQLFVRLNPLSAATEREVEQVLALGAQVLMLPMFQSARDAERFAAIVAGRARVVLLLETAAAARDIEGVVAVAGIQEIHVGINDLALSLGLRNRFEAFDCEPVERVAAHVRDAGLRFGIGGIGRVEDATLPIPSDLIYAQYPRLGATAALLSRAFLRPALDARQLSVQVARSRARLAHWQAAGPPALERARLQLRAALARCVGW